MHGWSPTEWTAVLTGVIGAVASAIVTVLNALQVKKNEQQAQARHTQVMAAVQKGPGQ